MKLNVLALSYLFPNPDQSSYGVFVYNRLRAVREMCDELRVIAPVQWYPFIRKVHPQAACQSGKADFQEFRGLSVAYPRFVVIPRYMKWFDSVSYLIAAIKALSRLNKEQRRFDLIDVHWTYPDILGGYALSKLLNRPFLVTLRGREALYLNERGGRKKILDFFLRKADGVIALSHELRGLALNMGVKTEKIRVIHNGVDLENFTPTVKSEARRKLGLPGEKKILLSVGSLIERKGHQELIKMLPELSRKHDLNLYIIGGANPEGDYSCTLRHMIKDLGLSNVHLLDKISHTDLACWYSAADLFCLATRGEGCPNVLLEALACGTPAVVTNVGAVPDLVVSRQDGFVVETMDEMKTRIDEALNTDWDRQSIASRGRKRTWQTCAEEVMDVYRYVLAEREHFALQGQRQ